MTRTVAVLAAVLTLPALAHAETWKLDPAHSGAYFSVRHMMLTDVRGSFSGVSGVVDYDVANPASLKVRAEIPTTTIDTREEKRDQHLRSPDFFDVAKFPKITFVSKSAKKSGNVILVSGDLTLHGVTKPVTLEVTGLDRVQKNPWGQPVVAGVARTKVNRKDFGLNWNKTLEAGGVLVGDEVQIEIALSLNPAPAGESASR